MRSINFDVETANRRRPTKLTQVLALMGAQTGSPASLTLTEETVLPPRSPRSGAAREDLRISPSLTVFNEPVESRTAAIADHSDDILQSTIESAKQIQQLAIRLSQSETDLRRRESELVRQTETHQRRIEQTDVDLDRRQQQLQQQASQIRIQQRHLIQLQSDILQSYEAVKILVGQLATGDSPSTERELLNGLRHELGERFDYISRRWEHLHGLLADQRVQLDASRAVDDSVKWDA